MQDKRNMLSYLLLLIFLINLTTLVINLEDHAPSIKLLKPEEKIGYQPSFTSSLGDTGLENNAKGTSSEYQNEESLSPDQQSNNPYLGGSRSKVQSDYSAPNWVDTRWKYRKNLTIDNTKVNADLTNFPLLVNLFDSDLRNDAQANGDDIFFTDDSGNTLDHEIEYYNRVYNSTHSYLIAWVKTNLSGSQNTVISMYYGNPTAENQENPESVWGNDYMGVWHLGETSGNALDSTSHGTSGSLSGGVTQGTPGQVGNAYVLDGVDDLVNMGDPGDGHLDIGTGNLTASMWILPYSTGADQRPLFKGGSTSTKAGYAFEVTAVEEFDFDLSDGTGDRVSTADENIVFGTWIYVTAVLDRSDDTLKLYADGSQVVSTIDTSVIDSVDSTIDMTLSYSSLPFNGSIDEVRVINATRSPNWISTEYNNQYDPDSFYSTGVKENSPDIDNWSFPTFVHRKTITIKASEVSGDLVNFPVLVDLDDMDLRDTNKVQADGDDILFTGKEEWIWSDELLENGDFETGSIAPWTTSGSWAVGTDPPMGGANPQAGSYCAYVDSNGGSSDYIQQDVNITDYSTHIDSGKAIAKLSGWFVSAELPWDQIRFRFQYLDSSKSVIKNPLARNWQSLSDWTRYSIDYNLIPANTRYIRVWAICFEDGWDSGSIDSFSVKIATLEQSSVGIKLDHEIEYFNQSYNTTHARMVAWVEVPRLSDSGDINITMYYGNNAVNSQENPSSVWDSNYRGVWHLGETSGNALDSTSYGTSGTISASGVTQGVTGRIGSAYDFDGINGNVNMGDPADGHLDFPDDDFSFSMWTNLAPGGLQQYLVYKGGSSGEGGYRFLTNTDGSAMYASVGDDVDKVNANQVPYNTNTWTHFVVTVNRTSDELAIYANGTLQGSPDDISTLNGLNSTYSFEFSPINKEILGLLDEVRVKSGALSAEWIATEYNNQYDPDSFYTVDSEEVTTSYWSIPSLRYRKFITINASQVNGTLTDFPVLIDIFDTDLHIGDNVQADGDDIAFTDASGNKLDYEIELFNQTYNNTHAHLVSWIRIPNLAGSSDTNITMYYGNHAINNQENPSGVWDSNYKGVWHLSEDPTGTVYDSTVNGNDGSSYGTMTSGDQVTGQIDGSLDFDGDDYISWSSPFVQSTGTYSFWVYGTDYTTEDCNIVASDAHQSRIYIDQGGEIRLETDLNGEEFEFTSSSISINTWYHIVLARTGDDIDLYLDGSWLQQVSMASASALTIDSIGGCFELSRSWIGKIDEVRVSSTVRSADWIATGYNNQHDPDSFYSVSVVESYSDWWADGSFSKRKDIVINRSKVSNDLNDFPILVDLHDMDLHDTQNIQVDGDDILFTDASGTKLAHEVELFNQTFNTTHAHLVAWVRVPGLSSTEDTIISMYYGNNVLENQESPERIWDSNYAGVWHLNEASGDTQDSTSYGTGGTVSGGITQGVDGLIDGAQEYDGTDGQVNYGDPVDGHLDFGTGNFSFSMWVYLAPIAQYSYPIYKGSNDDLVSGYCLYHRNTDGQLMISAGDGTLRYRTGSSFSIPTNTWLHVVGVIDRGSNLLRLYMNGTELSTTDITAMGNVDSSLDLVLARTSRSPDGFIDEFRLADVALSADWIATEYNNQYDTYSFYSVGPENVYDGSPPVVNDYGVDDPGTGIGTFWAEIIDTASEVTSAKIKINGTEYSLSNNDTHWIYQQSVNLTDYYTYQITNATDTYGNNLTTATSEKSYTFIQDSIAPTVVDWEYYAEQGPWGTFNANVSDAWGEIDTVIVNITNRVGKSAVMKNTTSGYINDTLVLAEGQIYFTIIVNDTGGNDFTSAEHNSIVPSFNNVPVAGNLTLSRDQASVLLPVYSNSTLYLDYDYYDEDGDNETGTEILWYKNSVLQAIHDDTISIAATYLFAGDEWNVTVRPKDGLEFGVIVNSSLVTIQNAAPEVTTASVSPGSPGTTTDLTATYNYFDTDGDSENVGNREIEWFKNGQPTAFTGTTLSSSNTVKGEDWSFKIRVHDGTQYSDWYQSANVTIINTAPTATSLNIVNAGNLRTNDDLVANWTFSDADGDSQVAYYILWYKNSLLQPSLNGTMTITAGNTSKDQSWSFKLIVNDGTINSSADWETALASATIQVLNSPPEASDLTITTTPYTTDNLVAAWNYTDADGDGQSSYLLRWYKDGVLQPSLNDSTTVSLSLTSKGEEWNYTLQVHDGEDYSIVYNSSSVTILNSVPTASGLTITSNPYNTTNLVAGWTFNDDDAGDSQAGYIIYWYRDGAPQS
ncbi:MAG: DUF2341 domain-containing protein, partial [Candidatus Hodarchaeales archaeon]